MRRDVKVKEFLKELGIDGYMRETLCSLLIDVCDVIKENKKLFNREKEDVNTI